MKVFIASPCLELNGVTTFSINLIEALDMSRFQAALVILSWPAPPQCHMPVPEDLSCIDLSVQPSPKALQDQARNLRKLLLQHAPCIYVANHESRIMPALLNLPKSIKIVGIVHADDERHYQLVEKFGIHYDAIVGVSAHVEEQLKARFPQVTPRLSHIPIGVKTPHCIPPKPSQETPHHPLRIIYAGKIRQRQKRVFDLPVLFNILHEKKIPFEATIVGDGPQKAELEEKCISFSNVTFTGVKSNEETRSMMASQDILLLTSAWEGLPNVMLEAMAQGCAPVVTDIPSGIRQVIQDGLNGLLFPVGDLYAAADIIEKLHHDRTELHKYQAQAFSTVAEGPYTVNAMAQAYSHLFDHLNASQYRRKKLMFPRPVINNREGHPSSWIHRIRRRLRSALNSLAHHNDRREP